MRNLLQKAKKHQTLLENFSYLSAVQGFNLLFPLLTYPFLIRVLEPEAFGRVAFAQGIVAFCSVFVNFGFRASAPRDIAEHRDDASKIAELVSSILSGKFLIWLLTAVLLTGIVQTVPMLRADRWLYAAAFGATATPLLFPDWYFLGIEKMKPVALTNFAVKLLSLGCMFALIRSPSDYLRLALIHSAGAILGALAGAALLFRDGVRFRLQPLEKVRGQLRRSAPLFYSSLFANLADKGGTLVVGSALGPVALAYYNLADKLGTVAANVLQNVGRTVYPNLARSRDKAFARKLFWLVSLVGAVGSLVMVLAGPYVIPVFAGEAMRPAIPILFCLAPQLLFAATGPMLANILLIEDRGTSLFHNTLVATSCYLATLLALWSVDSITTFSVALCFVGALVVRNAHRYWLIRRLGFSDWLHA